MAYATDSDADTTPLMMAQSHKSGRRSAQQAVVTSSHQHLDPPRSNGQPSRGRAATASRLCSEVANKPQIERPHRLCKTMQNAVFTCRLYMTDTYYRPRLAFISSFSSIYMISTPSDDKWRHFKSGCPSSMRAEIGNWAS